MQHHIDAAREALVVFRPLLALRHADEGLRVLGGAPPEAAFQLVGLRERAHDMQGDRAAQALDLDEMAALAHVVADDALRADRGWRYADWCFRTGRFADGIQAARLARDLALGARRPDLAVAALGPGAACLACSGHTDEALIWAESALEAAETGGDERSRAASLSSVGAVSILLGRPDMATTLLERAAHEWRALGDDRQLARVLNNLGMSLYIQGAHGRAQDAVSEAYELARVSGDDDVAAHTLTTLGQVELALGRPERARDHFVASGQLAGVAEDPRIRGAARALEGQALVAMGRPADALGPLHEAYDDLTALGASDLAAGAADSLADAFLDLADATAALDVVAQASDLAGGAPHRPKSLLRVGEAFLCQGRLTAAGEQVRELADALADAPQGFGEPDPRLWWRAARIAEATDQQGLALHLSEAGDDHAREQSASLEPSARRAFLLALHRSRKELLGRRPSAQRPWVPVA